MRYDFLKQYLASRPGADGLPVVAVEKASEERVTTVRHGFESILTGICAERMLETWRGRRVILKPNFCREGRLGERATVTAVDVVLSLLRDYGCEVVLGDGMTQGYLPPRNPDGFARVSAILQPVCQRHGVVFYHFGQECEKKERVEVDTGAFYLPSVLKDTAGLVNLAALKVHPEMVGTFAVKNLMGLLSGPDRLELHRTGVAEGI